MDEQHVSETSVRSIEVRPRSPLEWILAVATVAVAGVVAFFFLTFVFSLVVIALLVAPLVYWWNKRKRPAGRTRIVDVEYTVHTEEDER